MLVAGDRSDSANQTVYTDGVADGVGAVASAALTGITTFSLLGKPVSSVFSDRQLSFAHIGASLTAAQHASLNTIVRAYLTGVGAI